MYSTRNQSLALLLFLITILPVFCQEDFRREVPYTKALYDFIDAYFDHKMPSQEILDRHFNSAMESSADFSEEYCILVHKARCYYFYGLTLMEDYDISDMAQVDLNDTSNSESKNRQAARYFDQAIDLGKQALKIQKGSDAYALLCNGISANCIAKNTAYIIANGLKVNSYAKKAVQANYSNGTAYYLGNCQNVYAPAPFCKVKDGKTRMSSLLETPYIKNEKFDVFNILSAIGYCCQRMDEKEEAIQWYEKSLEIYPDNVSVNRLLKKLKEEN